MTESPIQLLARLARARREHLGLDQDELVQLGGPAVTTVGKIERAAQARYAAATQQQLERALGWKRGTVRDILAAPSQEWWDNPILREDFETTLIEAHVPDLTRAAAPERASALSDDELAAEVTYRLRRYAGALRALEESSDARDAAATIRAGESPAPEPFVSPIVLYAHARVGDELIRRDALRRLADMGLPERPEDVPAQVEDVVKGLGGASSASPSAV